MTEFDDAALRTGLIDGLRAARATERAVFDALAPADREAPGADGGWSPKDTLAHLSAWRQRQADRLAASREGRPDPAPADGAIDDINAGLHAERADWTWDRVVADAEATSEALIGEVSKANGVVLAEATPTILGDGAEHDLAHLGRLAAGVGLGSEMLALADAHLSTIDGGGWPARAAATARYNLACFHALSGNLDVARSLLRQALPEQADLRELAPKDDDLIALREELPTLVGG